MREDTLQTGGRIVFIPVELLQPNANQPRKVFAEEELLSLSASVAANGIIQPLSVRPAGEYYEVISGERRLRAAVLAGLHRVPCIIYEADDRRSAVYALLENIQRADLHFFEEAEAIQRLVNECGIPQEKAAAVLGKSPAAVSNKLRLLRIPPNMRKVIEENHLSERHARSLLRYSTEESMQRALKNICLRNMTSAEAERYSAADTKVEKQQKLIFKDLRIFLNTFEHAVTTMQQAGIKAGAEQGETEEYYIYTVRIPKNNAR